MMRTELENRVKEALHDEARTYRAPASLWDGVVAGLQRPVWRRAPLRTTLAGAAAAAAIVAVVLAWPGTGRQGVRLGPAASSETTAPVITTAPPPPSRALPSWAYPFLATKEGGGRELFLVTGTGPQLLTGDLSVDMDYFPVGLAGDKAVFLRRPHDDVFTPQLVIAPIGGGPEQTEDVTGASLSPDRKRIAYVVREGRTPTQVVVRDVAGGNERRLPLAGSPLEAQPLVLWPDLVGDTLLLEYIGEHSSRDRALDGVWTVDLRTAESVRDAVKWPEPISNVAAFDEDHVLAELDQQEHQEHVVIDIRTRRVVRTVEDVGDSPFLTSDGRGHLIGLGKGVHVYDGGAWIRVPGYEFAAW